MSTLALLVFLLLPSLGAANAQWLKLAWLALVAFWWMRHSRLRSASAGQWGILGALAVGLVASWPYGYPAMVGNWEWAQGWLFYAVAALFGALWWYDRHDEGKDDSEAMEDKVNQLGIACWLASVLAAAVVAWKGFDGIKFFMATKLGCGVLAAVFFVIQYSLFANRGGWWWPVGMLASASVLLVSGCRSGLLAVVVGCICCTNFRRFIRSIRSKLGFGLIGCMIAGAFCIPDLYWRLVRINPLSMGSGPRSQLLGQLLEAGVPLFGYGIDRQRTLIDGSKIAGGDVSGLYDRFHVLPVDLLAQIGWVGMACLAVTAVYVIGRILRHNADPTIRTLTGGFVAFWVCACFNPPSVVAMGLAAVLLGGLLWEADRPSLSKPVRWLAQGVCACALLVYFAAYAGERIRAHAMEGLNTRLPHRVLGEMWVASELNPWCRREYVLTYFGYCQSGHFVEPLGGKMLLLEMLKRDRRNPELEAVIWLGMGDEEKAKTRMLERDR